MIWMDVDTALSEVPVNACPLIDDTDFKTIETAVAYNAAGMALYWHFVTTGGVYTVTAVTPTSAGNYDWAHQNGGMYSIEIPASGGASINNDTEGFGWFTGVATGVLPWRGPTIGFRAAALNDALIDGGDNLDVSVTQLGGDAQSLTDLKDFADAGYDPATNKVQGVVLVDTATTLTNLPSIPANWITAAGIAADAITAAKVAADVTTEIQNGLATSAELAKVPKSDGTVAFNATAVAGMQSGLATASALATAQSDLDILTGTDGVTLATAQPNYTPATSAQATAIEADTQDLQTQIGTAGAGLTALGDTRLGNLDAAVSTRLASASYTAPLDAAGTRTAVGLSSANLDTQLGNIVADTNELQADWADGGRLDLILDARASQTSVDDVPTNVELAAAIITGLTTALTEGYRGTGATGSVRDLLYELLANITEFTISGATKTVKKLDGSTTAKTYTLDDATTPTGITETT